MTGCPDKGGKKEWILQSYPLPLQTRVPSTIDIQNNKLIIKTSASILLNRELTSVKHGINQFMFEMNLVSESF